MCASSAVSDYYMREWPNRYGQPNPFQPVQPMSPLSAPIQVVDGETREMMRQVLELLDKIDKKLGDVECMDGAKAGFLKSLDLDPANIGGG